MKLGRISTRSSGSFIAAAGHGDVVLMADAGSRIPEDRRRLDLEGVLGGWRPGC
jgi:D-ribose pyranose/furanose isomerase RbsD